jgi:hypothetical protein
MTATGTIHADILCDSASWRILVYADADRSGFTGSRLRKCVPRHTPGLSMIVASEPREGRTWKTKPRWHRARGTFTVRALHEAPTYRRLQYVDSFGSIDPDQRRPGDATGPSGQGPGDEIHRPYLDADRRPRRAPAVISGRQLARHEQGGSRSVHRGGRQCPGPAAAAEDCRGVRMTAVAKVESASTNQADSRRSPSRNWDVRRRESVRESFCSLSKKRCGR